METLFLIFVVAVAGVLLVFTALALLAFPLAALTHFARSWRDS
ncbi:hypothetical protein P3G55_22030 [Leptospira sp. 96542]|nr:hypothetical protein [Leptospira sp. 96542]